MLDPSIWSLHSLPTGKNIKSAVFMPLHSLRVQECVWQWLSEKSSSHLGGITWTNKEIKAGGLFPLSLASSPADNQERGFS